MSESRKIFISRRILGLRIGAGLGFLYSLIAATVNIIFIRDIPIHFSPTLILNQVIWATIAGGIMGLIVNWPEAGLLGILIASLLGAGTIFLGTLVNAAQAYGSYGLVLFAFAYLILPMTVLFIPLTALLRWSAGYFLQIVDRPWWIWRSLRLYLVLITSAVIVGSMPLYSTEARISLRKMDELIKQVQTSNPENAPWEFQTVAGTIRQADRKYGLEWTDDLRRFPYSLTGEDKFSSVTLQVVFAYFDSGETIACLFRDDASLYLCTQTK